MQRPLKLDGADRTRTVAMLAATLEAGDRAATTGAEYSATHEGAAVVVARAITLLEEAETQLNAKH